MRRSIPPTFVIALAGIVTIGAAGAARAPSGGRPTEAPTRPLEDAAVTKVIDGDTISVDRDGQTITIRLIGIDTPETKRPNTPVECFGPQAHDRLDALLPPGTVVRLEHDVERTDRYDRELAYVHRAPEGLFVNLAMVRDGFAGVLVLPPNTRHEAAFADAVDDARLTRRGLWSACGAPHRAAS